LETDNVKEHFILKQGNKIEIKPGVIHQLQAIKNSILIEVSTRDYAEDSIRLINGLN
jgi:quercetin dioxygenase-like cupin family protein